MQAFGFCLIFPILPLLIWRSYQEEKKIPGKELLVRYAAYTLAISLITTLAMVFLCDEGTSLQAKVDASPRFALKFAILELGAGAAVAFLEWMYLTRKLVVRVAWKEYAESGCVLFVRKYLFPCGIYLVAAAVILLNVSLMFDNVLWGDECFSANTARKSPAEILQVLYFWDNHPPLHYYWTKLFGELFGHTGVSYHLAALTPFFVGVILALVFFRKHFGNIPTAFFIIITGLASSCVRYNLEIRMYSLAFLGVACCYYCAYRALSGGKLAWFGMVFWALVGAYSHYYAMMTAGIMIFITGVAVFVRRRGKSWFKGVLALLAYIVGYIPWMKYLFHGTDSVSHNWWISEIMGLKSSFQMILCGAEFQKIVLCLLIFFMAVLFLKESSLFRVAKKTSGDEGQKSGTDEAASSASDWQEISGGSSDLSNPLGAGWDASHTAKSGCMEITVHKPTLRAWSDEAYGAAVGVLSIVGTLIAAYILCLVVGPVLTQRYLYPVSAVTILLLVISGKGCLAILGELGKSLHREWIETLAKGILVVVLAGMAVIGLGNYKTYRKEVKSEQAATEQALYLIGEVPEDMALVSNNVDHLGWTVLYYYYPERDIVTGSCNGEGTEYDRFWYFTTEQISGKELKEMQEKGYSAEYYGGQQIAAYPFELYYFERN